MPYEEVSGWKDIGKALVWALKKVGIDVKKKEGSFSGTTYQPRWGPYSGREYRRVGQTGVASIGYHEIGGSRFYGSQPGGWMQLSDLNAIIRSLGNTQSEQMAEAFKHFFGGSGGGITPFQQVMGGYAGMMQGGMIGSTGGALIAIFQELIKVIAHVVDSMYELVEATGAPLIGPTRQIYQKGFGALESGKPEDIIKFALSFFDAMIDFAKKMLQLAGVQKMFKLFSIVIELIQNPAFKFFRRTLESIGVVFEALLSPLEPLFKMLKVVADVLKAALAPVLEEIGKQLGPFIEKLLQQLENFSIGDLSGIIDATVGFLNSLLDLVSSILGNPDLIISVLTSAIGLMSFIANISPTIIKIMIAFFELITDSIDIKTIILQAVALISKILLNFDVIMQFVNIIIDAITLIVINSHVIFGFIESIINLITTMSNIGNFFNTGDTGGGGLNISQFTAPYINAWEGFVGWWEAQGLPTFQGGGYMRETGMASVHAGEFIFTPEQTLALGELGMGKKDESLRWSVEENTSRLDILIEIQKRRERKERFKR